MSEKTSATGQMRAMNRLALAALVALGMARPALADAGINGCGSDQACQRDVAGALKQLCASGLAAACPLPPGTSESVIDMGPIDDTGGPHLMMRTTCEPPNRLGRRPCYSERFWGRP